MAMQAVQVRLSDEQLRMIDKAVSAGRYPNRSEAIRDYLRKAQIWEAMEQLLSLGDLDEPDDQIEKRLARIRKRVHRKFVAPEE